MNLFAKISNLFDYPRQQTTHFFQGLQKGQIRTNPYNWALKPTTNLNPTTNISNSHWLWQRSIETVAKSI